MSEFAQPVSVWVIGAGLLGASVGLALRQRGAQVHLSDLDPAVVEVAAGLGAGIAGEPDEQVQLAVVAVPPGVTGRVVVEVLKSGKAQSVTDVASVKALPLEYIRRNSRQANRYVGGHPMAGREVSGPTGATADLFQGRPWVLCPGPDTDGAAVASVATVIRDCGATPVMMNADDHDAAVALVSHAPHLLASLVAGRLVGAPESQVRLAGPGITDVTRVAAGDPAMWTEILRANASAVGVVLSAIRDDLDQAISGLGKVESVEAVPDLLPNLLAAGVSGRARLPGKHGTQHMEYVPVLVIVEDRPGQLARLFADAGDAGINVEDVRIQHSQGQLMGLVELHVRPEVETEMAQALRQRGWTVQA